MLYIVKALAFALSILHRLTSKVVDAKNKAIDSLLASIEITRDLARDARIERERRAGLLVPEAEEYAAKVVQAAKDAERHERVEAVAAFAKSQFQLEAYRKSVLKYEHRETLSRSE